MTARVTVSAAQAAALVRQGDLARWAQESAAVDFHSDRARFLDKAAHGYVYHGLAVTNSGVIYDAYLAYVSELRTAQEGVSA